MNKKARGILPEKATDLPRRLKIFLYLFTFIIIFGTVNFKLIEGITFSEAFLRTFETLAFMFSSEILAGKLLEIFLALVGVFCVWWILWSVADMLLEGKVSEYLKIKLHLSKLSKMSNHYIIVGGGRVGEEIARDLHKNKKDFVIIEKDVSKIEKLRKKNYMVVEGDPTDGESDVFERVNIKKAIAIVLVLPETEKNLLLVLSAKELSPEIDIYARADNPSFANRLKKAGAKVVIVPEVAAAEKILQEFR